MIYLAMVDAQSTWDEASIGWRSVFYHRGLIIYHVASRLHLLCLGRVGKHLGLAWKVKVFSFKRSTMKGFAVGTSCNLDEKAVWLDPQELCEYQAVPAEIVPPLNLYISDRREVFPESEAAFNQNREKEDVLARAARSCFWDISLTDL